MTSQPAHAPRTRAAEAAGIRAESVVTVSHLAKRYGSVTAVADVSFDVRPGEIFGLLGPNGAGKTTTVECIQGLRVPDSGDIRVLGLDPRTDANQLRPLIGSQLRSRRCRTASRSGRRSISSLRCSPGGRRGGA